MKASFLERVRGLPTLGIGLSTEYGAAEQAGALDPLALHAAWPEFAAFLEVGVETQKGLDPTALAWAAAGLPTTYHFLDVNLDEPEDVDDPDWLDEVRAVRDRLRPAWMCGDAGLWHMGPRDRNHMLLLPPILTDESASELAAGIVALRAATGLEIIPENPPGALFVGDLHLADFFARVAERADTGLLLDLAHLVIHQRATGRDLFDGIELLPMERIVEIHVAGGVVREHEGLPWIEDDHSPAVLEETWALLEHVAPLATNLRAVVFECERNTAAAILPGFRRIAALLEGSPMARRLAAP